MIRVTLDKIASAAKTAAVEYDAYLSDELVVKEGYVLAVKILGNKSVYNEIENVHGRMMRLKAGDVIAGVLGHRRALHGYAGDVPETLAVGDRINVLNLGGVIGKCTSFNPDVGTPFEVEVMGAVQHFPYLGRRIGEPSHIGLKAIPACGPVTHSAPLVLIAGTCMNAGKTVASCEIVHGLARRGLRIAAAKVTGVALQRDVLAMVDYGAVESASFIDAGVVTTSDRTAPEAARRLITHLNRLKPDVIVIELGDGIFGEYGVQAVLRSDDVVPHVRALVLCANDPVGAWGGVQFIKEELHLPVTAVSGPVTDNEVGCSYVRKELNVPAANARTAPDQLAARVEEALQINVPA